jgi:hypothetical protein
MPRDRDQCGGADEHGDRAQGEQGAEPVTAALTVAGIRQNIQDVGQVHGPACIESDARIMVAVGRGGGPGE